MGGITPLLQTLKELENRGVQGKILTTDYLMFSEPKALKLLSEFENIQLKMYVTRGTKEGFHTKGYIFKKGDVYKIIVYICDIDFSKYSFFEIKCIPKRAYSKRDVILLRNGNFSELKMTKNGKRICLNCYDVWEYEKNNDNFLVKFSINCSGNNVNYKVSGANEKKIDSYTLGLLKSDINNARSEIEDTKKLVKKMFNNR